MSASESSPPTATMPAAAVPAWAHDISEQYQSRAANQFILSGNVGDRMLLPAPGTEGALGGVPEYVLRVFMRDQPLRFDVIFSYDIGNGLRIEKGGEFVSLWPTFKERPELPRAPRTSVEWLTVYFRYVANFAQTASGAGKPVPRIACVLKAAHLIAPALSGALNYDLNALALLVRDWSTDDQLLRVNLLTILLTENLNDLHPLIVNNPRATALTVPQPSAAEVEQALFAIDQNFPVALAEFSSQIPVLATQLSGATISSVENMLKLAEYRQKKIMPADLVKLKKELVEKDCAGLIEFVESTRTLDDLQSQEKLRAWLRQDIQLWRQGDLRALPMGYLICGPVGTGKTYLVECLAGEAGVPVVKIKNFRDKWVGSTEGNLEKIFRLLHALGRCFVFIDEADQALGRRDSGANDAGLSGRIYSMIAKEMSDSTNRGKIIWVLASSRPDLIEVDLKRPGRVDVKVPIFPTTTPGEGFDLLRALCARREVVLPDESRAEIEPMIPNLLTAGAAEALAVKVYRTARTRNLSPVEAVRESLRDYQNPIARDIIEFQIALAVNEATDAEFVPPSLRHFRNT